MPEEREMKRNGEQRVCVCVCVCVSIWSWLQRHVPSGPRTWSISGGSERKTRELEEKECINHIWTPLQETRSHRPNTHTPDLMKDTHTHRQICSSVLFLLTARMRFSRPPEEQPPPDRIHTHTHTHTLSLTHTHSHTHTPDLIKDLHTHTQTHLLAHHSLTHTHSRCNEGPHTHTHTHTAAGRVRRAHTSVWDLGQRTRGSHASTLAVSVCPELSVCVLSSVCVCVLSSVCVFPDNTNMIRNVLLAFPFSYKNITSLNIQNVHFLFM